MQYARPNSDITTQWSSTAGTHYTEVDEGVGAPNEADYISKSTTDELVYIDLFGLSSVTDPNIHTGHKLRVWCSIGEFAGSACTVKLKQGGTLIASFTLDSAAAGWNEENYTLSEAEAGNITNYAGLSIELEYVSPGLVADPSVQVAAVELEVPDVATSGSRLTLLGVG